MNPLEAARDAIAALLTGVGGLYVYTFIPEGLHAPAAVVAPADPYLTGDGQPFGTFAVRYQVALVADVADNQVVTAQLDQLIVDAVVALANGGWHVEQVGEPYASRVNENMHLACDLTITNTITL